MMPVAGTENGYEQTEDQKSVDPFVLVGLSYQERNAFAEPPSRHDLSSRMERFCGLWLNMPQSSLLGALNPMSCR